MTNKPEWKPGLTGLWARLFRTTPPTTIVTVTLVAGSDGPDPDLTWVYVTNGARTYKARKLRRFVIEEHGPFSSEAAHQLKDEIVLRLQSQGIEVVSETVSLD